MSRGDADQAIDTILCASDFSTTARLALRHARSLARRHHARLVLAHVIEPIPADPYPALIASPVSETNIRQVVSARLRELADEISEPDLRVDTCLEMGPPGPQLIEIATRQDADLIVVGTRGLTGFRHLIFGSVAEYVVRRATRPVLTVHPNDAEPLEAIGRVILPTDLSEDAEAAVEAMRAVYPATEAQASAARIVLLHADSTPPYLESVQHAELERSHAPDARREGQEAQLGPMLERLRALGFEVELRIVDGDPVEAITSEAEARRADLIVMSTHGRSALVNALLGRTAQRVVQHARCPVLTVRPERRR